MQSTKSYLTTTTEPNRSISVQLLDWSTTARKVAVIAPNTTLKSETMLEMTVVGLDGHWETTAPLMHSSFNDGVIQLSPLSSYSVLEIVEISHASFVHLLLQYVPHTVVSWIYFLRIWRPQYRRNEFWISFCLAKTAFFNDVTITSSLRTVVQVLIGLFFTIFQSPEVSGWFMPKIVKSCLNLSNLRPNYYRSILFSGHRLV